MQEQTATKQSWEAKRVQYIDGLKKPSEVQQLFALLFKKATRTESEEKKLTALIKAEKATERALNARVAVSKIINEGKADERKARNHRLIQQGLLLDFAGLDGWDRGELLGALMSMGKSTSLTPEKKADWKRAGDALLAQKEAVAI